VKLNLDLLLERARRVTKISVSASMEILVIDDVVSSTSGEPTTIAANQLRQLSLLEVVHFLHDNYAGDTVFIIRTSAAFAIVRPPFSELPVFYWNREGRVEVWSGLETPPFLFKDFPGFDLDCLAGMLLNWSWVTPATGLFGVRELLGGAVLIYENGHLHQRDLLAALVRNLRAPRRISYSDQVAEIRKLIINSVRHKLEPSFSKASILCSGGLDSSIVAVTAATLYPEQKIPLIHCFSEEHLHGDERFYFNALVNQIGRPAATVDMNAGASRTSLSPELLTPSVRPSKAAAALTTLAGMYKLAKKNGSEVVLTGDGGDQLFLLNNPRIFCREILDEAETPLAAMQNMVDISIMDRSTLWHIAAEVLRGKRAKHFQENFFGKRIFQCNQIASQRKHTQKEIIPNASQLINIGASRAFQYFGMRNAELNRVSLRGYKIDEKKIFVFWPLIRAAISAKRSYHLNGRRDRALERDAFRNELPSEIFHRVGKGGGKDFVDRYDFNVLISTLQKGLLTKYDLVGEHIANIDAKNISHDLAFSLVVARGIADWMELYE
jgi:Asparagine synthase